MRPVLFDSSIYITALRTGDGATLTLRRLAPEAPVWLSAVVLEELYAGVNPRDRRAVERLERDFECARRILVPNLNDWTQTGVVLARVRLRTNWKSSPDQRCPHSDERGASRSYRHNRQRAGFCPAGPVPAVPMGNTKHRIPLKRSRAVRLSAKRGNVPLHRR